ncbi:MAG TPA: type 4a pilus biogenesis protein PilO [Candidatus Macondimonas sp.]|jgi:type IV pilus assembly protein PilO|nr:type 4a pilus biogenesis protein PilO [Candidatus Macondimonas sp.]
MKLDLSALSRLQADLRNLDPNNPGSWPVSIRNLALVLLMVLLGGLGYWFQIQPQLTALKAAQNREPELRLSFESKQRQVANLDAYKVQLREMQERFATMLRQLPSQTEMANLLQDISQTRVGTGLEEQIFKPEAERPLEFYAEAPIRIRLTGTYHQMGDFASGLAALPRIVTLSNISLSNAKTGADQLVMDATAMTYRYLEEPQVQGPAAGAKPGATP